jgi:hypothetical protein
MNGTRGKEWNQHFKHKVDLEIFGRESERDAKKWLRIGAGRQGVVAQITLPFGVYTSEMMSR